MAKTAETGLAPENVKQIKAAQERHMAFEPGCANLTPEQVINWHPIGGISWEERAQRMKAAGTVEPKETSVLAASGE